MSERITKTYGYVVGSLGMTAGFATYILRSGMAYRFAAMNPFVMLGVTMAGTIGVYECVCVWARACVCCASGRRFA